MSPRVLLLKGLSTYDATRFFIDELAVAFRAHGAIATVLDLGVAPDVLDALTAHMAGRIYDMVFSFGLFAELRDAGGRDVAQIVGAPMVLQHLDYPLSHHDRLKRTSALTAMLVIDPSHAEAVRSVYGAERFPHVAFSPHGAVGEPQAAESRADFDDRPLAILFPGTFYKPGPSMWAGLDPRTRKVFDVAVEIALGVDFTPALAALDSALEQYGGHIDGAGRAAMRVNAFAIHERVRVHRRLDMLKALARTGLPVHLVGGGYDRDLYRFKSMVHLGERTLPEVVAMMRSAKVVLSVNANFGQGSHERPISAMLAGAVAATDRSAFYDGAFAPDEIIQLSWTHLARDLEALERLMQDPAALHRTALAGQARASASHRWGNRVAAILRAAERVREAA